MSQNVEDETPMDGVIPATDPAVLIKELSEIVAEVESYKFHSGDKCYLITAEFWLSFAQHIRTAEGSGSTADVPKIACASIELKDRNDGFILNDSLRPIPEQLFTRLQDAVGVELGHDLLSWEVSLEDNRMKLTPCRNVPPMTREELGELIRESEEHAMIPGEKWYVVPKQWWGQVHTAFKSGYPEDIVPINCGKISTETLDGYFLKPDLKETSDYVYIPQKVFERFRQFSGLQNERRDFIEREVVKVKGQLILQTYQRVVSVFLARDSSKACSFPLTGDETMADIRDKILVDMDLSNIPADRLRFYIATSGSNDSWELIDPTQSNVDAYFDTAQKVCIDINDHDGWFIKAKSKSSLFGPKSQAAWWHMVYRAVCMLTNWRWLLSAATSLLFRLHSHPYRSYSVLPSKEPTAPHVPGVCGLHNLGNTCFMASAVQCLSNVPPLTEYFLSGKFKDDINASNPLGTHGELVMAYSDVIHQLWSGEHSALHPRKLKSTIGQFAPRFSGYAQQDSQELLAYLLDGLHEDLNRIKKKPYVEEDENYDRLEEHVKAQQSWEAYKARNDSIIVDKFHGQLKSKLVCPVCAKVSIKFDPFCFLSVPLPPKDRLPKLSLTVMYNTSPKRKWAKFTVTLSSSTPAVDVIKYITAELGHSQTENFHLVLFSMGINHDDVRILDPTDPVISDNGRHELYAAQVDMDPSKSRFVIVKNQNPTGRPLSLPMVFTIGDEDISQSFIQEKVLRFVREVYHQRQMDASEGLPYNLMLSDGKEIETFPEGFRTESWPASKPITLIFQWKDNTIFNGYRGTDLIERECALNSKKDIHLMDCIDIFTREEQLGEDDSWYCPNCKKHERATKKLDLWNLPEILIVHLKRFHYSRWNRDKIDTPVVIPVRGFELNDKLANEKHDHVKYDLIAMSHHAGGLGGGHYTAAALNKETGKWYDYNDSSAFEGSPPSDPLTSRMPYLLVYQRRSVTPDGAHADSNFEMETD